MTGLDPAVERALAIDAGSSAAQRTVDITTTGARSGALRRIEIWFYRVDGVLYLSGLPGRRSWTVNLRAHPSFTLHVKNGATADLPATAREVTDPDRRRAVFTAIVEDLDQPSNPARIRQPTSLTEWMQGSPLFEVLI